MFFKHYSFLLFFVLCFFFKGFSQKKEEKAILDSINNNYYNNPKKASKFLHTYIKRNKAKDNTRNLVLAYTSLAITHELMSNIDSTLFYYYKSLSLIDNPSDIIQYKYSIAEIYRDDYKYKEAFLLYNQIYDIARKENMPIVIDRVNLTLSMMKNGLGQPEETIEKLTAIYNEEKQNNDVNIKYTRKEIIENYLDNNKIEFLDDLIKEGIDEALKNNNKEILYYLYQSKSRLHIINKAYESAIKSANLALENAKPLQNKKFISDAHFRLAEIYYKKNDYKAALFNLKNIDYAFFINKPTKLSQYYKLLAKTHDQLGDLKASKTYYIKHIEQKEKASKKRLDALESIHDITLKEQLSDVKKSYNEELQVEISEKEKHQKTKWIWTAMSGILLLLIISLFLFFKNKSKINQKRFDDLMLKIKAFEERKLKENIDAAHQKEFIIKTAAVKLTTNIDENKEVIKQNKESQKISDTTYNIDDKKVEEILSKIEKLEDKMYFLRPDCTLHNMAKRLKTNTSYLSKIINTHLDKSFSTYINELRINHAIIELKNNKRLRSYSVKGIAQEMGYKNADAFSRYFRAATGISPSVYIKQLNNLD